MHAPGQRPLARRDGLLTQRLDDELLIYDRVSHDAHSLDATAAALWQACDGATSIDELAAAAGVERDQALEGLAVLEERGLLVSAAPGGTSRRAMLRGGLVAGGAMAVGAPVIKSIVAPTPAAAQSPGCQPPGSICFNNSECCSGNCASYGDGGFCN